MKSRKNLEKAIVLGLLLSTSIYGTAWTAEYPKDAWHIDPDNPKVLIIDKAEKIIRSDNTFDGKTLGDFDTVKITYTPNGNAGENRPFGVYSARYDIPDTNIIVTVEDNGTTNNDALHLTNHYTEFNVKSFTAHVKAKGSDVFNISRDSTTDSDVKINGNVTAIVECGNGLRANASIKGDRTASITINGNTDITVNADSANSFITSGLTNRPFYTTAIWAGTETYYDSNYADDSHVKLYFGFYTAYNKKSEGKGVIDLQGDTALTLNGKGNFGILAGKNGNITVKDLYITANGRDSYGVSAAEKNITYGSDDSENKFGSTVTMNGITNEITMAEGGKAIYAQGVDANGNSNTVKSGEKGIGSIDFVGDVVAESGGTITLDVNGDEQNYLQGDIIAYGKQSNKNASINLKTKTATAYQGDALAANGGVVDVVLGDGSSWAGRADDYQDADNVDWRKTHTNSLETKFDGSVSSSGTVNMNLGTGSIWDVTGQSWVTNLKANDSVIIMDGEGTNGYALHVNKIEGSNTFVMNVRADETGDMLYVKNGTADKQTLIINNKDEVLGTMKVGDAIRFATVANSGNGFAEGIIDDETGLPETVATNSIQTFGNSTRISDQGFFNVDFAIKYNNYNEKMDGDLAETEENNTVDKINDVYNGGAFSEAKPGSDYVDEVYGGINNDSETTINTKETNNTKSTPSNIYIVRQDNSLNNISDAGKTIINMSRANYKNAIYMDRLNKRLGEARYINGEDEQGMWVRLRHDRIGQSGDFRSMNTMYELGYDVKQDCDNGERRIGMAIDYMRGSTSYSDIAGKGETKRYGLWLYDTWLGDKGHYVDYVAKWGHLDNDFDIYTMTGGEKVNGDYSNNVFSVSAEYGKKNDMGNNWYFEPQAQLQLARVTGADYVSSQNTKVSVDGINSLIGRAGFRLGRDLNENSTVYVKADLLHEFLGDQTITATDTTGTFRDTFENKGTWYDVGFGFATALGNNSYAFMDCEKSFGNDNDETYQINAGVQWTF